MAAAFTNVSASTKKKMSPTACRAPALRVAAICRCSTRITCAPCSRAIEAVASLEASSTTMISYGSLSDSTPLRMAEIHRPTQASSLCAGTMNEIICASCSIEQRHELSDDITRKDCHGDVAVPPRPAAGGDPADRHARQQQECADDQRTHERGKKPNGGVLLRSKSKRQAAKRQYPGDHNQAPAWHAQSVK